MARWLTAAVWWSASVQFCYLLAIYPEGRDGMDLSDFAGQLIAGLGGAAAGAWFAFKWQAGREDSRRQSEEVIALLEAQFALRSTYQQAIGIRRQFLDPQRDSQTRWQMLGQIAVPAEPLRVQFRSLSWTLDLGMDGLGVIDALERHEAFFGSVVSAINARNQLYADFREEAKKGGIPHPEMCLGLNRLTTSLYELTDASLACSEKANKIVWEFAKRRFPGKQFLILSPDKATD